MTNKPVLRVFRAVPRKGCETQLAERLASSSPAVVRDQPGCFGWIACAGDEESGELLFISIWSGEEAIKRRFGAVWRNAHLPSGYDALIDSCSVNHLIVRDMEVLDQQAWSALNMPEPDRGAP